ncbi:MAG: cytochrome c oxidase subunit I [Actinobacteria bacterium]|nr:cytochrome c oxidase subunit I [Actinomycetota bacterium]
MLETRGDELRETWASPPGLVGFVSAVNHKSIGLRFIVTAFAFLLIGGLEAMLIRTQLIRPENGFLDAEAYNQLFTMHGTTMMFLFAVPMIEGLAMYLVPLMIGTRDLPFPRLNAFGYWCFLLGGVLLNWSFLTGSVPDGGWFAYTPLTGPEYSPTAGIDYWLLGVTFVEIAGVVGALELAVLILRQRAPGMSLLRMPLFVWSILVSSGMMLVAFPAVITASILLELERKLGLPFYDPGAGGNPLLWQHLFWIFGHPEVYIMLLPATGIVSAVVAVHTRRPIVAYELVAAALVAIGIISFGLWVHHMFAVGIPVLAQTLFAVASATIAIPSGIQVFAWLATMLQGRPRWSTPMLYVVGFVVTFVAGGITGVMVAAAPFDWQVHDSFFVVAHFHYVLIGGVLFPIFAGLHHWFPKMVGRVPNEGAGRLSFLLVFVGFHIAFFPQHILGLRGMPRRVYTYGETVGWDGYNAVSTIGSYLLGLGVLVYAYNLWRAWRRGPVAPDDPWGGDGLEWSTASPPEVYNFRELPVVGGRAPRWEPAPVPDNRTASTIAALAAPDGGGRQQLRTTMVAAEPDDAFAVAGPTPWPLGTAVAIGITLVGVLIDHAFLAAVGAILVVAAALRWTSPPGGWRARPETWADLEPPRSRPGGWHGLLLGLVAVACIGGSFLYAYFYLFVTADGWPPSGVGSPGLLLASAAVAAAVAGSVAVGVAGRRTEARTPALLLAGVLGMAALAADALDVADLRFSPSDHAYGAAFVTLRGFAMVVTAVGVLVLGVALRACLRRPGDPWTSAVMQITRLFWLFVAATTVVVWSVLQVTPRVSGGDGGGRPATGSHHSLGIGGGTAGELPR